MSDELTKDQRAQKPKVPLTVNAPRLTAASAQSTQNPAFSISALSGPDPSTAAEPAQEKATPSEPPVGNKTTIDLQLLEVTQLDLIDPAMEAQEESHYAEEPTHSKESMKLCGTEWQLAAQEVGYAYAQHLSLGASRLDVEEAIRTAAQNLGTDAGALFSAMEALHGDCQHRKVSALCADLWPALAYMSTQQAILVLSQEGETLIIHDRTQPGGQYEVALEEFAAFFTGDILSWSVQFGAAQSMNLSMQNVLPNWQEHWFWGEFGKFRRQVSEIALGSFVANTLALAVALFSLQVFDRVIPHQSEETLWVLAAGAGLALLLEGLLKFARSRLLDVAGRSIEVSVQNVLMNRLLGMRSDLQNRQPAQVFSAIRDFGSVREFFTTSTIGTLADVPFILLFLFMVASIGGPVVWVLLLGGFLMVVPGFFMQKKMMRLTKEMQGASIHSARLLQEVVFDLDTIKSMRGEHRFAQLWGQFSALSAEKTSDQRKLASILMYWSQGIQQAAYLCAVIAGTFLVFNADLSVGAIIAVGILTGRTLGPLSALSGTLARWSNVKTALEALDEVAAAPQDHDEARTYLRRDALKGQFELRSVQYRYHADAQDVLDLPGVMIPAGQHVALLGPNGSGKSTLLRLLSGLYAPSHGKILLDGTEINQIAPKDLRRLIGYLGQDVRLFSGSLRENLDPSGREADDARLMEALDFAGLGEFVRHQNLGLDLKIAEGGHGLSVGQRQSVGWARLWLQNPQICLLDEPTAALDQKLETALIARLERWLEGRTTIVATHRVPILELMDRTLVLQGGRMAVDGPRSEVIEHLSKVRRRAEGAA